MEKRKEIAFFLGTMRKGGAERVISILANNFIEKGWEVSIVTLLDNKYEYTLNKKIKRIPLVLEGRTRIRQLPHWFFEIRKYVKLNEPYKIVSFFAIISSLVILSTLGLKTNIIVSERNDPKSDGRSIFIKILTYLLYPKVNKVIFQTEWAKSCFSRSIQNKGVIIPNPITITTSASAVKKKKIVSVGSLTEQKNQALLIESFSLVYAKYPDYTLHIYGEGKLRTKLEKLISSLNLKDVVFLPGKFDDIHERIKDSEFFVLSSDYEGLSNALLEAMAMGIPCISTNCAGSNEIIVNFKNGIIVPVKSKDCLMNAMVDLIENEQLNPPLHSLNNPLILLER